MTIDLAYIVNEVKGDIEGIDKGIDLNENTTGDLSFNKTLNISLHKGGTLKMRLASLNKLCFEDFAKKGISNLLKIILKL